ncbi:hypothetical protein ES708_24293 [subsurface metagenome]
MAQENEAKAKSPGTEVIPVEEEAIVKLVRDFPRPIIESVLLLVQFHSGLQDETGQQLDQARQDLQTTEECIVAAEELGIKALISRHKRVKTQIEKEIIFLENRLAALESGYLPVPRFDYASIEWSSEAMNYQTLRRLKEAKDAGIFDDFGVVQDKYTHPRRRRDPLLVGILRGRRGYEEHFFIGVWH